MKITVLGVEYTVLFKPDAEVCADMDVGIGDCGGYCSPHSKTIAIANLDQCHATEEEKETLRRLNLRHEIVHAFLHESGLAFNANGTDCWAKNEEMVDWFAIQGPKIYQVWQEAGAI